MIFFQVTMYHYYSITEMQINEFISSGTGKSFRIKYIFPKTVES